MPTSGIVLSARLEKSETAGLAPVSGRLLMAGLESEITPTYGLLLEAVVEVVEGQPTISGLLLEAELASVDVAPVIISRGYLLSARLISAEQEMLNPITAQARRSGQSVTITGAVQSGGAPQTWIFNQVAGATVQLVGSGNSRTFSVPATFAGDTIRITVSAIRDGVYATPVEAVVSVYPHLMWMKIEGGWQPL